MEKFWKSAALAAVVLCATSAGAVADRPVSADGLDAGYATDAYPGFEPKQKREPEFKEKSFWYSVKRDSPEAQLDFAHAFETNGNVKAAAKAYEALVREWPASAVAAEAQRRKASILTRLAGDKNDMSLYADAFDEYEYLMYYFPGLCNYAKIADLQYKIAIHLQDEKKSMFGFKYDSNREKRLRFESVVRLAPGSSWVPDAMLTIGDLRIGDDELQEAAAVFDNIVTRFPKTEQAKEAVFKACKCRYDLVMRQEYNASRCRNALNGMKMALTRYPDLNEADVLNGWIKELSDMLEENAWNNAVFYDTRQRTKQAAVSAYERFLAEFPESSHRGEAVARIEAIKSGAPPLRK